jgi:hypothetical protein
VTWRARIVAFGSTGLLVIAGVVCVAVFSGGSGQFVGFTLIGVGIVIATGLVFLEVGLSEDRDRAREQREAEFDQRPKRPLRIDQPGAKRPPRLEPPRLGRSRGHRRRLG